MAEDVKTADTAAPEPVSQSLLDDVVTLHNRFMSGRPGGRRLVLRRRALTGLTLAEKDLRQADFGGCIMTDMDLSGANFREASLYACDLSRSDLSRASFIRADLRGTRIENARLMGADLHAADLRIGGFAAEGEYNGGRVAQFHGADLSDAKLSAVLAQSADFSGAVLARVNLAGADMRGAQFENADLTDAEVRGAQLLGANMRGANLAGVRIDDIRLQGIDMTGAVTDTSAVKKVTEFGETLPTLFRMHRQWVSSGGQSGKPLDLGGYDLRPLGSLAGEKLTAIVMRGARCNGMNFSGAQLQNTQMQGADFANADLRAADIRASSAQGTRFSHADLRDANFGPLFFGDDRKASPCFLDGAIFRYADCGGGEIQDGAPGRRRSFLRRPARLRPAGGGSARRPARRGKAGGRHPRWRALRGEKGDLIISAP